MIIEIRNYVSGSFLLTREPAAWEAIVVLDSRTPHTDFVERNARRSLYLSFDDVVADQNGKRKPAAKDVQSALTFGDEAESLLVCCRAGQSRSAALAYLICHRRLGADAAKRLLKPERHVPNPLIVEIGARPLGDPSIERTFKNWLLENQHVKLKDYWDEIERELDDLERQGARNLIVES